MALRLQGAQDATNEIALARYPAIRVFMVEERFSQAPCEDVKGVWQECTPENAHLFSAVAYFFGRELHNALNVPVGLVVSSVGGTRVESWMASRGPRSRPGATARRSKQWDTCSAEEFEQIAQDLPGIPAGAQPCRRGGQARARARRNAATSAEAAHAQVSRLPGCPLQRNDCAPDSRDRPRRDLVSGGKQYLQMPERYAALFPEMICQWRSDFRQERLPFLFVQLANYQAAGAPDSYARLRESQRQALRLPATGMVVAIDIGEAADIHPRNKQEVGRRLSLWALRKVYGMEGPYMRVRCTAQSTSKRQSDRALRLCGRWIGRAWWNA